MRVDNINMLNDTMAIMDRGYYEVNGKRVNLKLSEKERKEKIIRKKKRRCVNGVKRRIGHRFKRPF